MPAGRKGPSPLTAKRELYRRLMEDGVSNAEACRVVGVNRRTGGRVGLIRRCRFMNWLAGSGRIVGRCAKRCCRRCLSRVSRSWIGRVR